MYGVCVCVWVVYISYDVPGQARPGLCDRPKHVFQRASVWPAHACCVLTLARQPRGIVLSTLPSTSIHVLETSTSLYMIVFHGQAPKFTLRHHSIRNYHPLCWESHILIYFFAGIVGSYPSVFRRRTPKKYIYRWCHLFLIGYINRDIGQFRISFWLHRLEWFPACTWLFFECQHPKLT